MDDGKDRLVEAYLKAKKQHTAPATTRAPAAAKKICRRCNAVAVRNRRMMKAMANSDVTAKNKRRARSFMRDKLREKFAGGRCCA